MEAEEDLNGLVNGASKSNLGKTMKKFLEKKSYWKIGRTYFNLYNLINFEDIG